MDTLESMLASRGMRVTREHAPGEPLNLSRPAIRGEVLPSPPAHSSANAHIDREPPGSVTVVFVTTEENLCVASLRELVRVARGMRAISRLILVTPSRLTSVARTEFGKSFSVSTEHFLFDQLMFNVTRHVLVPKHAFVPLHDRKCEITKIFLSICETLKITSKDGEVDFDRLPHQSMSDPITRFHGGWPGDVIMYERQAAGQTGSVYFRVVR